MKDKKAYMIVSESWLSNIHYMLFLPKSKKGITLFFGCFSVGVGDFLYRKGWVKQYNNLDEALDDTIPKERTKLDYGYYVEEVQLSENELKEAGMLCDLNLKKYKDKEVFSNKAIDLFGSLYEEMNTYDKFKLGRLEICFGRKVSNKPNE